MKKLKIAVGTLVAFNNLFDATWFEVVEINGFRIKVREYDGKGTPYTPHETDITLVKQAKES